jgi:hypothetical protein
MHRQLAVVAVNDGAAESLAEGAGGGPALGRDGSDSFDGFEEFSICEAGFGVKQGTSDVRPVIICSGF